MVCVTAWRHHASPLLQVGLLHMGRKVKIHYFPIWLLKWVLITMFSGITLNSTPVPVLDNTRSFLRVLGLAWVQVRTWWDCSAPQGGIILTFALQPNTWKFSYSKSRLNKTLVANLVFLKQTQACWWHQWSQHFIPVFFGFGIPHIQDDCSQQGINQQK